MPSTSAASFYSSKALVVTVFGGHTVTVSYPSCIVKITLFPAFIMSLMVKLKVGVTGYNKVPKVVVTFVFKFAIFYDVGLPAKLFNSIITISLS